MGERKRPRRGERTCGEGSLAVTWQDAVFLVGFVAYIAIRGHFESRTKGVVTQETRGGGLERALLGVVFLGCILLPAVYLATNWLAFADTRLPEAVGYCGVPTLVAALWLFWRSHADLDRNWSRTLEIRADHQLVEHGVYRRVRHPMYAAILLFCIAQGLLLQNWLAGWSGLAAFSLLYAVRAPREERMLCDAFGEQYRDYMARTGRLWPRIGVRET